MAIHARTRRDPAHAEALHRQGDQSARRRVGGGRAAFPAHEVFKKLGKLGLLGVNKPEEYGGMGLDYSYAMAMAEELGHIALRRRADGDRRADRHGDARARPLRQRRAAPRVPRAGDRRRRWSAASACQRAGRRLRRRRHQDHRAQGRRRLRHQRRARCGSPTACRPTGCACSPTPATAPVHKNKSLIIVPMNSQGRRRSRRRSTSSACMRRDTGADLLRRRARAAALPHRRGGHGLHRTRCCSSRRSGCGPPPRIRCAAWTHDRADHRLRARAQDVRPAAARQPGRPLPARRAARPRSRRCARSSIAPPRSTSPARTSPMLASMAKLKAGRLAREVPDACLQYWGGMGFTWDNRGLAPVSRRPPGLDRRRRRRGHARHHRQVHAHRAGAALSAGPRRFSGVSSAGCSRIPASSGRPGSATAATVGAEVLGRRERALGARRTCRPGSSSCPSP